MSPRTLTVATLNLWNISDPWPARRALIDAALTRHDVDVLFVQECLRFEGFDQAAELAAPRGFELAFGAHGESPYPFGNAVLSRWPVTLAEVSPLPRVGTDENRSVTVAHVATPWGRLPCAVTHLNWRLDQGYVREAQVAHVVSVLDAHCGEADLPALLAGDFNAEPDSDEMRYLRGLRTLNGRSTYFNDCWRTVNGALEGATFSRRNPYAAVCREPDRRLDYVFVKGPNSRYEGYPIACELIFDTPDADGVWPSDHFGVLATIGL
ncbi:MAG: endonuclease/exonuclease/phosphatase family protein [Myxococcales bacterium]|nr:endonuclease/exonuclease/phosphatase family protein [Myxococcales bacterium]